MIVKAANEDIVCIRESINLEVFKDSDYNKVLSRKYIKLLGKKVFYGCLDRWNVKYWIVAHKT